MDSAVNPGRISAIEGCGLIEVSIEEE